MFLASLNFFFGSAFFKFTPKKFLGKHGWWLSTSRLRMHSPSGLAILAPLGRPNMVHKMDDDSADDGRLICLRVLEEHLSTAIEIEIT